MPVIADADTGYGNSISVIRTVQAYERAGVAAIHIEDQVAPKKCGHMALARLRELGFRLVIFPISTVLAAARRFGRGVDLPTDQWHEFIKNDPPLASGATAATSRLVIFGGGYPPIKVGGQLAGAIGVSGGHDSQDMEVAQAGLAAIEA